MHEETCGYMFVAKSMLNPGQHADAQVLSRSPGQSPMHAGIVMELKTWSWLLQEPDPPLHEAAKAGDAAKVKSLLETGADPCEADSRGKVPYDVAADKAVRDAFRRSYLGLCVHCMPTCVGEQKSSRGGAVETCTVYITLKSSCV